MAVILIFLFKLFLLTIWNLKFQILVINELIHIRVIVFADYEDFKEIAESAIFSFEIQTLQLNRQPTSTLILFAKLLNKKVNKC